MSQMDEGFCGVRHELPLNDEQRGQNVIVTRANGRFEFLEEQITPWQLIQTNSPGIAHIMQHAKKIVMGVYSGNVETVPVHMGGWIMTCDVFVYLRSRIREVVPWGTFLAMLEWALLQDFEMIFTPRDNPPDVMVEDPFLAAKPPHHRARNALVGRAGVEIHPAMFDVFPGVGVPIRFTELQHVYRHGLQLVFQECL